METDQSVGLPDIQSVHFLTAPLGLQMRSRHWPVTLGNDRNVTPYTTAPPLGHA